MDRMFSKEAPHNLIDCLPGGTTFPIQSKPSAHKPVNFPRNAERSGVHFKMLLKQGVESNFKLQETPPAFSLQNLTMLSGQFIWQVNTIVNQLQQGDPFDGELQVEQLPEQDPEGIETNEVNGSGNTGGANNKNAAPSRLVMTVASENGGPVLRTQLFRQPGNEETNNIRRRSSGEGPGSGNMFGPKKNAGNIPARNIFLTPELGKTGNLPIFMQGEQSAMTARNRVSMRSNSMMPDNAAAWKSRESIWTDRAEGSGIFENSAEKATKLSGSAIDNQPSTVKSPAKGGADRAEHTGKFEGPETPDSLGIRIVRLKRGSNKIRFWHRLLRREKMTPPQKIQTEPASLLYWNTPAI